MNGSNCNICGISHTSPLELHLCSIMIGNVKPVGWCLWCGKDVKKHKIFCTEQCRITYIEDVAENQTQKQFVKTKRRRARAAASPV